MQTRDEVYNKSGHQIVVIIFLSCIIVFLDIEQFYADILCSTTVNFFLGVVFFDIVILPVQYLFLLGYTHSNQVRQGGFLVGLLFVCCFLYREP